MYDKRRLKSPLSACSQGCRAHLDTAPSEPVWSLVGLEVGKRERTPALQNLAEIWRRFRISATFWSAALLCRFRQPSTPRDLTPDTV